jgi:hypothetical protein
MRTTITLDPDVARLLEDAMHRERRSFKAVLNDALRRGLSARLARATDEPFKVVPHRAALLPGWDPAGFNRLADELEDEAIVTKGVEASRR